MGYTVSSLAVILSSLIAPLLLFVLENDKTEENLTFWYWIQREVNVFVYYGGIVIFPYIIGKWVSNRIAIILFVLIMVPDGIWRIFWYIYDDKWKELDQKIYGVAWSAYDNFQVFLLVPFIIWLIIHKYHTRHVYQSISYQPFQYDNHSAGESKPVCVYIILLIYV